MKADRIKSVRYAGLIFATEPGRVFDLVPTLVAILTLVVLGFSTVNPGWAQTGQPAATTPKSASDSPQQSTLADPSAEQPPEPPLPPGIPPEWQSRIDQLREASREHSRIRMQQETLRRRADMMGNVGDRVRQSMTDRFHELDTQEREIRLRKRTLLQQLSEDGDKLLEVLQEQQAQLALAESQTADEAQRAAIQGQIQELDTLIRNLEDIQRNPNRFVEGQPADTPPQPLAAPQDWESMPPRARFAARRIQELEQQIRFLRSRLDGLESQVEELKVLMETQSGDMPVGPGFENPELGPRQPLPPSEFPGEGPNRRRFPGPPPGPRRDEIPPAGFLPGSEPGFRPQPLDSQSQPGRPVPPADASQQPAP